MEKKFDSCVSIICIMFKFTSSIKAKNTKSFVCPMCYNSRQSENMKKHSGEIYNMTKHTNDSFFILLLKVRI